MCFNPKKIFFHQRACCSSFLSLWNEPGNTKHQSWLSRGVETEHWQFHKTCTRGFQTMESKKAQIWGNNFAAHSCQHRQVLTLKKMSISNPGKNKQNSHFQLTVVERNGWERMVQWWSCSTLYPTFTNPTAAKWKFLWPLVLLKLRSKLQKVQGHLSPR